MGDVELRDTGRARAWLTVGLSVRRFATSPQAAHAALQLALELAADGQPLPPTGFLADLVFVLAGRSPGRTAAEGFRSEVLPASVMRKYEDHVASRLLSDRGLDRAADAVRPLKGRERMRAAAFIVRQIRERAGFHGVLLSPAVVKSQLELAGVESSSDGDDAVVLLERQLDGMVAAFRGTVDLLGPEDLFELEHGTATAEFGQRLALRQIVQTSARWESELTSPPPRDRRKPRETPSKMSDEDAYPVGGFASISNRGSIESLLHSQLAYMESGGARPDLFDVHYLRDELLYYARDENQFLRPRRGFAVVLAPDLVDARIKDADSAVQRIVLVQAFIVAAVNKLIDWLDTEAVFFSVAMPTQNRTPLLAPESALFEVIFREQRVAGLLRLIDYDAGAPPDKLWAQLPEKYQTNRLWIGSTPDDFASIADQLVVGKSPALRLGDSVYSTECTGDEAWREVLKALLAAWL